MYPESKDADALDSVDGKNKGQNALADDMGAAADREVHRRL